MAKESKSLYDSIMEDVKRASNAGFVNFFGLKEVGSKCRIRFLDDLEDGKQILFHEKWIGKKKIFGHPCLAQYGKDCPNCDNAEGKDPMYYAWNIYNYESKKVEIFMYKANKCSPIPVLTVLFKENKTLLDRDMVVQKLGEGAATAYAVVPVGKDGEFVKEVKKFSLKEIMNFTKEAFNTYGSAEDEDVDDEDMKITKKSDVKGSDSLNKKSKIKSYSEDDESDYDDMSARELYKLCCKRDIKVKKNKDEDYYIEKLKEDDEDDEDELPF